MNWPGLLITAPFATVRRNQLCQVFKAGDEAAAAAMDERRADTLHRPRVTSQITQLCLSSTELLVQSQSKQNDHNRSENGQIQIWYGVYLTHCFLPLLGKFFVLSSINSLMLFNRCMNSCSSCLM